MCENSNIPPEGAYKRILFSCSNQTFVCAKNFRFIHFQIKASCEEIQAWKNDLSRFQSIHHKAKMQSPLQQKKYCIYKSKTQACY